MLDPADIEAIIRGLVAQMTPGLLYGYMAAAATSVLITLALTIPQGAKKVEKKMLDPAGAVQQARAKELAAFKTEVAALMDDKLKALQFPEVPTPAEVVAAIDYEEIAEKVKIPELDFARVLRGEEARNELKAVIREVQADRNKMSKVREGRKDADEKADADLEEAVGVVAAMAERPEDAALLQRFIAATDTAVTMGLITEKKGARAVARAQDLYAQGQDLRALVRQFQPGLLDGAAPSVTAKGGGYNPG